MSLNGLNQNFIPYTLNGLANIDSTQISGLDTTYVKLDGTNSMTNDLILSGDPQTINSAIRKQYLDTRLIEFVLLNTYNTELTNINNNLNLKLNSSTFNSEMKNYETTTDNHAYITANYYTQTYLNNLFSGIYTVNQVDNLTTLTNFYNKTYIDSLISNYITSTQINGLTTLTNFYNKTYIDSLISNYLTSSQINALTTLPNFYNKISIDSLISNYLTTLQITAIPTLTNFFNKSDINNTLTNYGTLSYINSQLAGISGSVSTISGDLSNVYTKLQVDSILTSYEQKIDMSNYKTITSFNNDISNYYTQPQVNALASLTNFYNKSNVDSLLTNYELKSDLSNYKTIASFNLDIANYLTAIQINSLGSLTNFYNKTNVDSLLTNYELKSDLSSYYTKVYIDSLISNYVSASYLTGNYETQANARNYTNTQITNNNASYTSTTNLNTILSSYATISSLNTVSGNMGNYLSLTGGTLTGDLKINSNSLIVYTAGDTNKGVAVIANNNDGASYSSYNGGLESWSGIGFRCRLDGTTRHIFDTRTGDLSIIGSFNANGNLIRMTNTVGDNYIESFSSANTCFTYGNGAYNGVAIYYDSSGNVHLPISLNGISATQLSFLTTLSSDVQTQLDYIKSHCAYTINVNNQITTLYSYVDEADALKLNLTGGTLTGNLNGITPTQLSFLTTLTSDVQTQLNNKLNLSGGTIVGDFDIYGTFNMNGNILCPTGDIYAGTLHLPASVKLCVAILQNGILSESNISTTALSYLDASSSIQSQLNNKADKSGNTSIYVTKADNIGYFLNNINTYCYFGLAYNNGAFNNYAVVNDLIIRNDVGNIILSSSYIYKDFVIDTNHHCWTHSDLNVGGNLNGITPTQLTYLTGITSDIQNQLNLKVSNWNTSFTTLASGYKISQSLISNYTGNPILTLKGIFSGDYSPTLNISSNVYMGAYSIDLDATAQKANQINCTLNLQTSGYNTHVGGNLSCASNIAVSQGISAGGTLLISGDSTLYGNLYLANNPYISLNGTSLYNNNMIELHPGNSGIAATFVYGLGVNGGVLRLNSQGAFKFYNSNTLNYTIDSAGNTTQAGTITSDSNIFTQRLIIKNNSDGYGSAGITNEFGVHAQIINLENNFWDTNGITDCNMAYNGTMLRLDNRTYNQYYQFWLRIGTTYSLLAYLTSSSSGLITTSDEKLKHSIEPIKQDKSLTRILNTNICSFFYNHATEDDIKQNKKSIGIVAQQVALSNPHCIYEHNNLDDTKNLSVSYNDLFLHNINATKELYSIIQTQQQNITTLHGDLTYANQTILSLTNTITDLTSQINDIKSLLLKNNII